MTEKYPNGAGFFPEYEDVPRDLSEPTEKCEHQKVIFCGKCGGETVDKLYGDECVAFCPDCNYITYG